MENEWEQFLLSKKQVLKLAIFSMLVKENTITISMIEQQFGITKRVAKSLLTELKEEITDVENDESFQLIHKDHMYYLGPIFDSVKYTNRYYSIRTNYYQDSSVFLVMMYMLEKRKSSILKLSNELAFSQSYIYKLIDLLNDFFRSIDVKIEIGKNDNTIELIGAETEIRLLYYYSCIYGYSTFEWPIKSFSLEKVKRLQIFTNYMKDRNLSFNNITKRFLIDAIYLIAIEKGKKTERFDNASLEIFGILKEGIRIDELITYMKNNTSLTYEEIENEICNLLFLINHIIPDYLTIEEKIKLGKEFSELENNSLVELAKQAIEKIPEFSVATTENKNYFIFELVVRAIVFKYFPMWKFSLEFNKNEFPLKTQRLAYKQLVEVFNDYLPEESLENYVRRIIEISTPFVLFKNGSSIKVYIEFTYKPHFKLILATTLLFSYKKNAIEVVQNIDEADIVISDSYPNTKEAEYFYFSDIYVKQNWEELNSFLQEKMLQRGFQSV